MKTKLTMIALAAALAMSGVSAPPAAAQGTFLSRCTQQALVGAGAGAVLGALASEHHRTRTAVIGAAVGGLGTFGVCRWLTTREEQRVEQAYYNSLNRNRSVRTTWQSDAGATRTLRVSRPTRGDGVPSNCRIVNATINDPQQGTQQMPPETFCRDSSGQWTPASS